MTLTEFRATGKDCPDLGAALSDEALTGYAGRLYLGCLYIERWDDTAPTPPPEGPTWLLTLGRDQFDDDLAELEVLLYHWAIGEGYEP